MQENITESIDQLQYLQGAPKTTVWH